MTTRAHPTIAIRQAAKREIGMIEFADSGLVDERFPYYTLPDGVTFIATDECNAVCIRPDGTICEFDCDEEGRVACDCAEARNHWSRRSLNWKNILRDLVATIRTAMTWTLPHASAIAALSWLAARNTASSLRRCLASDPSDAAVASNRPTEVSYGVDASVPGPTSTASVTCAKGRAKLADAAARDAKPNFAIGHRLPPLLRFRCLRDSDLREQAAG